MVHLHSFRPRPLVASPSSPSRLTPVPSHPQRSPGRRSVKSGSPQLGERSLQLIHGSLSGRKVERQSPLLASLHRISTGALVGLGVSLVGLSALALHWQNQWAKNYAQLEASKVLEHRLHESASVLEQHHIGAMRRPGQLLPTSSENLIHLPEPVQVSAKHSHPLLAGLSIGDSSKREILPPLPAGY
jgi:hypothetical protein